MTPNAPYSGFYINLDRSPDRRAEMEAEFARYGLSDRYQRFAAADGNIWQMPKTHILEGEMGCFTSFCNLFKQNIGQDKHLHILEDDVSFAPQTASVIDGAIQRGWLDDFDILFTDVFIPLQNEAFRAYKSLYDAAVRRDPTGQIVGVNFGTADLRGKVYASASSFLLNKNSIQKLHDLCMAELTQGPAMPFDLFLRKINYDGLIKAGVLFPFVTTPRLRQVVTTTIGEDNDSLSVLAPYIARQTFFVGCDLQQCMETVERLLPTLPADDLQARILQRLLAYSITDKFRLY